MSTHTLRLDLRVGTREAQAALVAGLLVFAAGPLASESLTLSTFYPAPLGVYAQIITTGSGNVNTILARDQGKVGVGTNAPGYALDVQQNANNGGGTINGQAYVAATGGQVLMFGSNTVWNPTMYNGSGLPGGISIFGRPRIGDWGQMLEIGEPAGTNGGEVLQISQANGIQTGQAPTTWAGHACPSAWAGCAPSIRNTLDDNNGNMTVSGHVGVEGGYYNYYATGLSVSNTQMHVYTNETANHLRVGSAWNIPGIYSEQTSLVLGANNGQVMLGPGGSNNGQYLSNACWWVTYWYGATNCTSSGQAAVVSWSDVVGDGVGGNGNVPANVLIWGQMLCCKLGGY